MKEINRLGTLALVYSALLVAALGNLLHGLLALVTTGVAVGAVAGCVLWYGRRLRGGSEREMRRAPDAALAVGSLVGGALALVAALLAGLLR